MMLMSCSQFEITTMHLLYISSIRLIQGNVRSNSRSNTVASVWAGVTYNKAKKKKIKEIRSMFRCR